MNHFFSFLLVLTCFNAYTQTILPVNGSNQITFTDVVKADNIKKELLFDNIKTWLVANRHTLQQNTTDSVSAQLIAKGEFPVYARGYVSKKIHGKITYDLTIEVKDNKYRYFFTGFVFHYYKEDRNFAMKPTGQTKPLEETKAQGWQSLWEQHKSKTRATIESHINQLVIAAVATPAPEKQITATKNTVTQSKEW